MKGKLVLRECQNLKEGDKVIYGGKEWEVDSVNLKEDNSHLDQFYIEYKHGVKLVENHLSNSPRGTHILSKRIPLSFSDYPKALELGEGKEVEFEITTAPNEEGIENCFEVAKLIIKEEKKEDGWGDVDSWDDVAEMFLITSNIDSVVKYLKENYELIKK